MWLSSIQATPNKEACAENSTGSGLRRDRLQGFIGPGASIWTSTLSCDDNETRKGLVVLSATRVASTGLIQRCPEVRGPIIPYASYFHHLLFSVNIVFKLFVVKLVLQIMCKLLFNSA